jgi:hypothetical protein
MLFASVQTALAWLLSIVGHQQVKERMVDSDLEVEVLAAKRAALMERSGIPSFLRMAGVHPDA